MQKSIPKLTKMTTGLFMRVFVLLFLLSGVANATVHVRYVRTTGNDANNGQFATPWRTIQHAVNNPPTVAGAGDTLIIDIGSGFYNENVVVSAGWPSQTPTLACAITPGSVKLVLKGPYVTYNGVNFIPTSPVGSMRNPANEAQIQQVSGGPGIQIGELSDVEIMGLTIRNTNDQAIGFDADENPSFICDAQFPTLLQPGVRYPAKIKIKHNIIETVGTTSGNVGNAGIVGIANNDRSVMVPTTINQITTMWFNPVVYFYDNVVRDVVGGNLADNTPQRIGLYLRNVNVGTSTDNTTGQVKIHCNYFGGKNMNYSGGGIDTMSTGIYMYGTRGRVEANGDTNWVYVYQNRVENTTNSAMVVRSDIFGAPAGNETLTSRWVMIRKNSIYRANTTNSGFGNNAQAGDRGGIEVAMNADDATLPNANVRIEYNVIKEAMNAGVVYHGTTAWDLRRFSATHNIFDDIMGAPSRGGGVGAGIAHINPGAFLGNPNPVFAISRLDAGGNWWGSNAGPDHDTPTQSLPAGITSLEYNRAAGNARVVNHPETGAGATLINHYTNVWYSPWLGDDKAGEDTPDDVMDDMTFPYDCNTWGFDNLEPKNYYAKELLGDRSEIGVTPELHTIVPDMKPNPPVSAIPSYPDVNGYITKAIALSKDNDTINAIAGTFQENIQVTKALYLRGPQDGNSASARPGECGTNAVTSRDINTAAGIQNEAKIVKGRFAGLANQQAGQAGALIYLYDKNITVDGFAFYTFTANVLSNRFSATSATSSDYRFRNNFVTTMDVDQTGNGTLGSGGNSILAGETFVYFSNHSGRLWVEDNNFQYIIGKFDFATSLGASTALGLENVTGSSWIRRNYFEGDPTVLRYDDNSVPPAPIRIPMSYGIALVSSAPTGTDSIWVAHNYIYRPDNAGILITDLGDTRNAVNNIVVRSNTIEEANVSSYYDAQNRLQGFNFPNPNDVTGGIEVRLDNANSNNIYITWNHIKNARNAAIYLQEEPGAGYNTPSNLMINYNLFNTFANTVTLQMPTVSANYNPPTYTYATQLTGPTVDRDAGVVCGWTGSGNVNAKANWWGGDFGPTHGFNFTGNGLVASPENSDKVHYSPWLAGPTLPDDIQDDGPRWNNNPVVDYQDGFDVNGETTNLNTNMTWCTWGYQDRTQKSYWIRISSPGVAACQPQEAHDFAKDGDIINVRDESAFEFEDLFVTKNIILDSDKSHVYTKLQDIHVFDGKMVSLEHNYMARNINLACPVTATGCAAGLGARVANGYINTYTNPLFLKELFFTGTVCETPATVPGDFDKYVRGVLKTTRTVGANAGNSFGNMGFNMSAGPDNLGDVTVGRIAGPDVSNGTQFPDFSRMVTNGNQSINRLWSIEVENDPYTANTRNVEVFWYAGEDNNNSVLLSRPWNKNDMVNGGTWEGLQPATVSQLLNPRRVTSIAIKRLEDTLTIAENACNIMADLSEPSSDVICNGESVSFDITITGGQPPYTVTYTENTVPQAPVTLTGAGPVYTLTITPSPNGPQDRIYRITQVSDITGCNELSNLGVQRDLQVKPTPTALLSGNPQPICNEEVANLRIDFTGVGPWVIGYRIGAGGALMTETVSSNPYTLVIDPQANALATDQTYDVILESVSYVGGAACNGNIVGNNTIPVTVHPSPTATFVVAQNTSIQECACEPAELDLLLTGQGPWIVEYTIDGTTYNTPVLGSQFDPTNGVTRTFQIFPNAINPNQCPSGQFDVQLTKVTDGNGCENVPSGNIDVVIDWRPLPNVTLTNTSNFNVCQNLPSNTVDIPVIVNGRGPWTVEYRVNGVDRFTTIGTQTTTDGATINLPVVVDMMGVNIIQITGVQDGFGCGNANIAQTRVVNVNPRPSAGWISPASPAVCTGGVTNLVIEVNGIGPWTFTHTQNGVAQPAIVLGFPGQQGPAQFSIPVNPSTPTTYAITSITDGNSPACTGQIIGSPRTVDVAPLPTASLLGAASNNICAGQQVSLEVFVTGRGPWTVSYTANGIEQTAVVLGNSGQQGNFTLSFNPPNPQQTTTYCLTTVSDGTSPSSPCTNSATGVCRTVTVNPTPTAQFTASRIDTCQGSTVSLPTVVTGRGPWFITYEISPIGGGAPTTKQIVRGNSSTPSPAQFNIEETLNGAADVCIMNITDGNNCASSPSTNNCIRVNVGQAPSAVVSGALQNVCVNDSVTLRVDFTGNGSSYCINYRENNLPARQVCNITDNPAFIRVPVTQTGNVVFTLSEVSYSGGGCVSNLVGGNVTVNSTAAPTASFSSFNAIACSNDPVGIGLVLSGRGPWTLEYTNNGTPMTATVGTGTSPNPASIVWNLNLTQSTAITLNRVTDSNGCSTDITGQTVNVTITPAPSAAFANTNNVNTCGGSNVTLPINLTGNGPWTVFYLEGANLRGPLNFGAAGDVGTVANPFVGNLTTAVVGTTDFRIFSVSDNGNSNCTGTVDNSTVTVNVSAAPTAAISNVGGNTPTICMGESFNANLNLTGASPWTVVVSDGANTQTLNVSSSSATVAIMPMATGMLTYNIVSVTDANNCTVNAGTGMAMVNVNMAPTAEIVGAPATVCAGSSVDLTVNLTGMPPFTFTYDMNGMTNTVNTSQNAFTLTLNPSQLGLNTVSIVSVDDAGTCNGVVQGSPANFNVSQGPTANIANFGSGTVTLGQSADLTVNFTGMAPWSITYQETPSGNTNTVSGINSNPFTLTVTPSQAGANTYRITSVSDASGCAGAGAGAAVVTAVNPSNFIVVGIARPAECNGGTGQVSITAFIQGSGNFQYEYSLDGVNWQRDNNFFGVAPGTYTPYARELNTNQVSQGTPITVSEPVGVNNLVVSNITVNSANLRWDPFNGAGTVFYEVQYRIANAPVPQNWTVAGNNIATNVFDLINLQNNTTYEARVRQRCNGNVFSNWETTTFTTSAAAGCAVPGGIFVDNINNCNAEVFWNAVPGAVCYIVQYEDVNSGGNWQTVTTTNTSVTLTNLTAQAYRVRVRTNCDNCSNTSGRRSAYSTTFRFDSDNANCRVAANSEGFAENFKVYPNPNNGNFTVSFETAQAGTAQLQMLDVAGKAIFNRSYETVSGVNEIPVEMTGYATGVYVLKFVQGEEVKTVKVILN